MPDPTAAAARSRWSLPIAAGLYLAGSLALHHAALGRFATATIGRVSADPDAFTWWLNWLPYTLGHGLNPLLTNFQHYPLGVNAMWNTAVPLLGLLLAPVTLTAGPVAAFNTGMVLGPVVAGVATVAALRPYVRPAVPRIVAGALYAFSPFQLAHLSAGHLNLVWAVLPPALLYLAHRIFVEPMRRPVLLGALTGLALALQTVLYTQTVATGVLLLLVTALVLAVRFPSRIRERLPSLLVAGGAALGTYAVLAGYPLYLVLAGPVRPRVAIRSPEYGSTDLANVLSPTYLSGVRPVAAPPMLGNLGEQGGYLGVAMLAVLLVAVVTVRAARIPAAVGVIAFVVSLGPTLHVATRSTGVPLPWGLATGLPLLGEVEPGRIQVFTTLALALVVALFLARFPAFPQPARAAALALVAVALVSWLPADAQRVHPAGSPAFVAELPAHLRAGDVAEIVPRPTSWWYGGADALRWQVASGMAFRMTGGYFIGSDEQNALLIESPRNRYQDGANWAGLGLPPLDDGHVAAAASDLRRSGVTVVLVVPEPGRDPAPVLEWTRRVTGAEPEALDGAWIFRVSIRAEGRPPP
ncbi:MAG: hypothetical protein OJJ54_20025 [Pseudonocardia sp.]|nr:hypothetical protein [Pseudonocardia sp.]